MTIAVLAHGIAVATPPSAQLDSRQDNQRARVLQGWRSGRLAGGEAARLTRQQSRLGRTERTRADGGGLGPRQRARLDARQDRASARSYAEKHNRRDQW
jgi:hypothetical protein